MVTALHLPADQIKKRVFGERIHRFRVDESEGLILIKTSSFLKMFGLVFLVDGALMSSLVQEQPTPTTRFLSLRCHWVLHVLFTDKNICLATLKKMDLVHRLSLLRMNN